MTQTAQVEAKTLRVPGATLYYEVLGNFDLAHGGWGSDPQEFADRLRAILQGREGI